MSLGIRAAVFEPGSHDATWTDCELGELRDDEVLVRIVASGICHTDLSVRDRLTRRMILGHEGAGIVERVGAAVRKVQPGDAVVLSYLYCGGCRSCEAHEPSYCHQTAVLNFSGFRADGTSALTDANGPVGAHFFGQSSLATHSVANVRNVVKVDARAPLELLGPLGCGVQTGAGTVMNVLQPQAGEPLLVIGAGGVGMSALLAAVVAGCEPIVVIEPNAQRRALALQLGAHLAIDPRTEPVVERVRSVSPEGMLYAVDTSGLPAAIETALEVFAPRGRLALLTATPRDAKLTTAILPLVARGVSIHGVVEGESIADEFIPRLVSLVCAGRFPIDRLVKFYSAEQLNQALRDQEAGVAIKPIIRMSNAS